MQAGDLRLGLGGVAVGLEQVASQAGLPLLLLQLEWCDWGEGGPAAAGCVALYAALRLQLRWLVGRGGAVGGAAGGVVGAEGRQDLDSADGCCDDVVGEGGDGCRAGLGELAPA